MNQKAEVFLRRYLVLVDQWGQGPNLMKGCHDEVATTVGELAGIWDCSPRAVRETLRTLGAWSLIAWRPSSGRGNRSALTLLVHPVHVYFTRARRAEQDEHWVQAAFWYAEILADCPCIPGVAERLAAVRQRLHLPASSECCKGDLG